MTRSIILAGAMSLVLAAPTFAQQAGAPSGGGTGAGGTTGGESGTTSPGSATGNGDSTGVGSHTSGNQASGTASRAGNGGITSGVTPPTTYVPNTSQPGASPTSPNGGSGTPSGSSTIR